MPEYERKDVKGQNHKNREKRMKKKKNRNEDLIARRIVEKHN